MEEEIQLFIKKLDDYCTQIKAEEKKISRPLKPDEISSIRAKHFPNMFMIMKLGDLINLSKCYCEKTQTPFHLNQELCLVKFSFCPKDTKTLIHTMRKNPIPLKDVKINLLDILLNHSNNTRVFNCPSLGAFNPIALEKIYIKYYLLKI